MFPVGTHDTGRRMTMRNQVDIGDPLRVTPNRRPRIPSELLIHRQVMNERADFTSGNFTTMGPTVTGRVSIVRAHQHAQGHFVVRVEIPVAVVDRRQSHQRATGKWLRDLEFAVVDECLSSRCRCQPRRRPLPGTADLHRQRDGAPRQRERLVR